MPSTNKKYWSINDQIAQQIRNNQNTIEILTKLDQSLHSNDSYVTLTVVDSNGKQVNAQFPTIGFFKQELDKVAKAIRILSGVEGNPAAIQIASNAYKRIITADLNFEPKQIKDLQPVTVFKTNPNWIFDSFLNPKISIEIDLTDKIEENIKTIQSRRFIVEFDKEVTLDENNEEQVTLTTLGQLRQTEFEQKYKGKSDIDMIEFVTWLDSPGVINRVDDTLIDEDYFKIEPNRLQFKGNFTVLNTEVDTLNKKLWYILDTLTYYDVSDLEAAPKPVQLKVGDLVNVNPNTAGVKSTTVYKVLEISTITSDYRVRFEAVYGEEPIPVRLNALAYYSQTVPTRKVRISVGFDEYNVTFLRSVDDDNNLIGQEWSPGIGYWTNELRLDNAAGQTFSEYYIKNVYDYGLVLEDLVQKKVPNYYGIKPNAPILDTANFKVVQTNLHLTNTVEAEQIRDLHNNKNNLLSEISQIQEAVNKQNRILETTVFNSEADRKRAEDELTTLQTKLNTKNETKVTLIKDILASQKNLNKIDPIFKVRGFWPMPDPVSNTKTTPQETVQFEVWYKKTNKSGAENPIATFENLNNSAARQSSAQNTTVNENLSKPKTVNASFSNWTKFKTDARKRTQDPITKEWKWEIEDVANADTPNINQLEIDILPGEVVQIKIKGLSEVGWPETPMESDFSNIIEIPFPDDLKNVLSDDQFILKEASADDIQVKFERDLEARGLNLHLNSSIRIEDIYYAHKAESITSGFKDSNGKIINLYEYLLSLVNRITALEEVIKKSKGELEVSILNKGSKTKIFNGNNISFIINLEDYMQKTKIGLLNSPKDAPNPRTYKNDIYVITDYVLQIKNTATDSPLGLMSYRMYGATNGGTPSPFAYTQTASSATPQAVWVNKANVILTSINNSLGAGTDSQAPRLQTQVNNQWIWLQTRDTSGNNIYTDVSDEPGGTNPTAWSTGSDYFTDFLANKSNRQVLHFVNPTKNSGMLRYKSGVINTEDNPLGVFLNNGSSGAVPLTVDITTPAKWTALVPNPSSFYIGVPPFVGPRTIALYPAPSNTYSRADMATSIHPVIDNLAFVTETSSQLLKLIQPGDPNIIQIPINIYFRCFTGTIVQSVTNPAVEYIDTATAFSGGDMPHNGFSAYSAGSGSYSTKLQINSINQQNLIVGDKIVLTGLTNLGNASPLYAAEGVPLRVIHTVNNNTFVVDWTVPPGFTATQTSSTLAQVHLITKKSGGSTEMAHYAVYGNLPGQDIPYVRSYVEFNNALVAASPQVHNKKLRFYMENENSNRPFEFQLEWQITQYKKIVGQTQIQNNNNNNNLNQFQN